MQRLLTLFFPAALIVLAAALGLRLGTQPPPAPSSGSADFEQRLEQLGLTEDQLEDTLVEGVQAFIARQQQAQVDAERTRRQEAAAALPPVDASTEPVRGPQTAEYSLIEYSDYECPYCKRFHATALEFFDRTDNLNWVYRHFPLESHEPQATRVAIVGECVADHLTPDAFWNFNDTYFAATRAGGRGMPGRTAGDLAQQVGLTGAQVDACLDDATLRQRVRDEFNEGRRAGVTGTPGIFIRHNPTGQALRIPGAVPLPDLEQRFASFRESL